MLHSLPEPESPESFERLSPERRTQPWSGLDLAIFGIFAVFSALFFPYIFLRLLQLFRPGTHFANLSGIEQIAVQVVIDLLLVGFIAFLVRSHGRSFAETIHWFRNYTFSTTLSVTLGATIALTVVVLTYYFPPAETPIEKILASSPLYLLALFGIGVAPLLEEIIFRGFLFTVLAELAGGPVAFAITAVLFASVHILQLWGSWAAILLIFVLSCVLSAVRLRTNSLIPSWVIHISYNGMLFLVTALSTLSSDGH